MPSSGDMAHALNSNEGGHGYLRTSLHLRDFDANRVRRILGTSAFTDTCPLLASADSAGFEAGARHA